MYFKSRYNYSGDQKPVPLNHAVRAVLEETDYHSGRLEGVESKMGNIVNFLTKLTMHLHQMGSLSTAMVEDLLHMDYVKPEDM